MLNLLPENEKRVVLREYNLRRASVAFMFVAIGIICAAVFLLPSDVSTNSKEAELTKQLEIIEKSASLTDNVNLVGLMKQEKDRITLLSNFRPIAYVSDVIAKINNNTSSAIRLNSFNLSRSEKNSRMVISGKADNREALIDFNKKLEQERLFTSVILPVSDLAKGKNIDFAITIEGNF